MGKGWEGDHSVIYGVDIWNGWVGLKVAICVLEYELIGMDEIDF